MLVSLLSILVLSVLTWLVSIKKQNVAIVDSIWSLMIWLSGTVYAYNYYIQNMNYGISINAIIVWAIISIWAFRLAYFLTKRNWNAIEDSRYQAIRKKFSPYFNIKSLFIIFIFQAIIAWLVSLPLMIAFSTSHEFSIVYLAGIIIALFGVVFEIVADRQMLKFKSDPKNKDKVMNQGLWAYSRHPNYFGEFCIWWGVFIIVCSSSPEAYWTIVSPLIMSFLLLKFSGVSLMEKDIGQRRPKYVDYIKNTPAFIPNPFINRNKINTNSGD